MRGGYDKYIGQTINGHTWRPPPFKPTLLANPQVGYTLFRVRSVGEKSNIFWYVCWVMYLTIERETTINVCFSKT